MRGTGISRRAWLAAASAGLAQPRDVFVNPQAPAARVSVGRCADYGSSLLPALQRMFDSLGGLGRLVKGKTVAVKINLTGSPRQRVGRSPVEFGAYTHPAVIGAVAHLLSAAGARRVRILEGCFACGDPLEEFMYDAGWNPMAILNAGARVEMENTNVAGRGSRYARRMVPKGGLVFPGFDLNHSYDDCDVMVSLAKLKEHATCGITLSMKNMFGATPITIYGDFAGKDEPAPEAQAGRGAIMHRGSRQPSASAPAEIDPASPRNDRWRMPRLVVDICGARPIDLAIVEGIETLAGGEGAWIRSARSVKPGLLVAGLNPVSTDAVAAALMGFDPMADRGQAPFEQCDSTLRLAEEKGLGTRDLRRIEVVGTPLEKARVSFRAFGPGPWRS
jgi:uncharacterized protein (DUF362 family)